MTDNKDSSQSMQPKVVPTDEWTHKEPVDTPALLEIYKNQLSQTYRHRFVNDEEFELFVMLPVTDVQRKKLIEEMSRSFEVKETPSTID